LASTVSVINCATNSVKKTLYVGLSPCALCTDPLNGKVYVASEDRNCLSVISCATDSVIKTVPVGALPYDLFWNPLNEKVYCSNWLGKSVSVVDCRGDSVVKTIAVGTSPGSFAWDPDVNRVYVANYEDGSISVLRDSMSGVEEAMNDERGTMSARPTVVRSLPQGAMAFDAMGRRVKDQKPGVYFVRDEGREARDGGRTYKVVITR
jgi:YVTN family beta-propeller protein